tara:strand:+ start:780 stop:1025 length:246 start_codon:yes stop_codon:yes gene_type:complete
MNLTTDQLRALMLAKPAVISLRSLCGAAGINYGNLYMRLYRGGDARQDESEKLGAALFSALPSGLFSAPVIENEKGAVDVF